MPNKPIIDIQVNSADFERFAKLFAEYSKTLDEQPAAWQKLNAAMGNAGTAGDALASGALTAKEAIALAGAQAEIIAGALKEAVKAQDALGDSSHATNKRMSELAKTARSLGSEIAGVGQWVLRLGSGALAGLGLGAIVGGFGIGGLTDALTSRGRAAGGVGLSPGQLASFQAYGQRFLGEGALHAAAAAQLSYGSVAPLSMLGIDFNRAQGMSSADLAFEELKGAVRNWQAAKAAGLAPGSDPRVLAYQSLGGDLEDVRRAVLQGGVPAVAAAQGRYRLGAAGMEYDMRSWQNFKDQLDAAGRQIEATFGKALTPLVPEFTQLSKEFVTAFASFAKSKDMGILIDDVKVGLKGFVGWLEGPDSKKLASNLALVADEVFAVAEKLKWLIPKPATPPKWASDPKWLLPHGGQNWTASIGSWWHNLTTFSGGADAMQKAMLGAIAGQESSGSATIVNKTSGALGRYQFMPGTADQYLGSSWVAKYGSTATAGGRANFLGSPAAQQRAALAYLADLEKVALAKHLSGTEFIKGIAEGWYGGTGAVGNPNISGGPGYPTTGQYGMQVLERLIKALLTKQANGTKVSITNQTSARVAVSVNGRGDGLMAALSPGARSAIAQYDLAYQVSPIILVGGIASSAQGGLLPIVALYGQDAALSNGTTDPNTFFARYLPLPGSTLISNQVGMYPFANQTVAANALIAQPLTLSMLMIAPVNQPGGYLSKLSTFTSLQNSLQQHCLAAGTFSVATPAYVYANLILTSMTDVTHGDNQQKQIEWQLDFIQPLLTAQAAAAAQSNFFSKVSSGASMPMGQSWSGNPQAPYPPIAPGLPGATAPSSAYAGP